ncbi:hypothetical protein KI372_04830, partial [Halobacterium salinarum]|nr:hypothetical protein [Halobacterium salinarum]
MDCREIVAGVDLRQSIHRERMHGLALHTPPKSPSDTRATPARSERVLSTAPQTGERGRR